MDWSLSNSRPERKCGVPSGECRRPYDQRLGINVCFLATIRPQPASRRWQRPKEGQLHGNISSTVETGLDKLYAVLEEMAARCYREATDRNGTLKFYSVRHTTVIVEIDKDGGFEAYAPVEKTNSVDATIAALRAL